MINQPSTTNGRQHETNGPMVHRGPFQVFSPTRIHLATVGGVVSLAINCRLRQDGLAWERIDESGAAALWTFASNGTVSAYFAPAGPNPITFTYSTTPLSVGSPNGLNIQNGTISRAMIADGAIDYTKIDPGAVRTAGILDANVTSAKLALTRIDVSLGANVALVAGYNSPAAMVTPALPANSVWDFVWAALISCTTSAAVLANDLLNGLGSGLSAGSGVNNLNYGGGLGAVQVSGRALYTANGTGTDVVKFLTYVSHAATLLALDANFGSGSASYIRGVRIG